MFWKLLLCSWSIPAVVFAQSEVAPADAGVVLAEADDAGASDGGEPKHEWRLAFSGYAELQFSAYGYSANRYTEGGAKRDFRLQFDTTRASLELEAFAPYGLEAEIEVEFEHGGAGAALELEYDEFGEFETEVEKGGEVVVEELYLRKYLGHGFTAYVGRFYLNVGLLSERHLPTQMLTTSRSEAETTVLSAVWDEMGAGIDWASDYVDARVQLVNGLDSSYFGSARWVGSGHQGRFELVRATDLAGVLRVDARPAAGLSVGASAYYGGTSHNRPKADLVRDCANDSTTEVAPCGYLPGALFLLDGHVTYESRYLRAAGLVLWGSLENARAIGVRNDRLSDKSGAERTPVASEAILATFEAGFDLARIFSTNEHRLELYGRLEYYDTMFRAPKGLFDNARYERYVVTAGVGYTRSGQVTAKFDWTHRWFGEADLRPEDGATLAFGFVL